MRRADVVRPDPLAGGRALVFGPLLGAGLLAVGVMLVLALVWIAKNA
jgi:hypothetical protein